MTTNTPAKQVENAPVEPQRFDPTRDNWAMITEGADEILGHDLAKDEILDALQGVPFMVTRMTFQEGTAGMRASYVSCECVVAPRNVLERRSVLVETLPFDPGDLVVFNDGSTGIYRQCVAYLHAKGFIALPDPVVVNGKGAIWNEKEGKMEYECSYDLPPNEWADIHAGELRYTPSGAAIYQANVRCFAKRGIRISDGYSNAWTQDGKTRYLA